MTKSKRSFLFSIPVLASLLCTLSLTACTKIRIASYPPANTAFVYSKDDSVPFSTLQNAPVNPDRGFRGEAYITLGTGEAFPGSGTDAYAYLDSCLERLSDDDVKIMQIYVYLKNYCNSDLPASAQEELKNYLEYLYSKGVRALLRFAYESSSSDKKGPRTRNIISHLDTLKDFFCDNASLIKRSVYAFQLGLIGLWGEGHSSVHTLNKRRIIRAAFDAFPEDMFVMVRTPQLLSLVPEEYEARAGIHNDYMVGYSHEWGMMDYADENYPVLLNKCKYSLNDGELPWGDQSPEGMSMSGIIAEAVGYGLGTLSIEHNYTENGNEYLIKQWQSVLLDEEFFSANAYPYNPHLLVDGKISVFDYLKHHLGYQIAISNFSATQCEATFLITNYGFAAPFGYTLNVYSDGVKVYSEDLDALNIFSEKYISVDFPGNELQFELVNRRSGEKAFLYNDLPVKNGLQTVRR